MLLYIVLSTSSIQHLVSQRELLFLSFLPLFSLCITTVGENNIGASEIAL